MLRKLMLFINPIIVLLSFWACNSVNKLGREPFIVTQAIYHDWVRGQDEKGTDVILQLKKVNPAVNFDSIVFRGVRLSLLLQKAIKRLN